MSHGFPWWWADLVPGFEARFSRASAGPRAPVVTKPSTLASGFRCCLRVRGLAITKEAQRRTTRAGFLLIPVTARVHPGPEFDLVVEPRWRHTVALSLQIAGSGGSAGSGGVSWSRWIPLDMRQITRWLSMRSRGFAHGSTSDRMGWTTGLAPTVPPWILFEGPTIREGLERAAVAVDRISEALVPGSELWCRIVLGRNWGVPGWWPGLPIDTPIRFMPETAEHARLLDDLEERRLNALRVRDTVWF